MDKLKIARVIPVYKSLSYRPISLLSIFNKILENLIYKGLLNFLEQNHVLLYGKFSFRSNLSTTYVILLLTNEIQSAIENNVNDTVNHTIILLKNLRIMVLGDWQMIGFRSYLSNRKQFFQLVTRYRNTSLLLAEFLRNQC